MIVVRARFPSASLHSIAIDCKKFVTRNRSRRWGAMDPPPPMPPPKLSKAMLPGPMGPPPMKPKPSPEVVVAPTPELPLATSPATGV